MFYNSNASKKENLAHEGQMYGDKVKEWVDKKIVQGSVSEKF